MKIQEALIDRFLQLQYSLRRVKWSTPLRAAGLGNVLKDSDPTPSGLIPHKLQTLLTLLIRLLLEKGSEPCQGLGVTVEVGGHGKVDVACIEFGVYLSIEEGLTVLGEVLPNPGLRHLKI